MITKVIGTEKAFRVAWEIGCRIINVGVENVDPIEELKRLGEQIESATELAALKPIFYRLNEIIRAFPDDFDVQFVGNEIKQRLMARGTLLKQQETSPPPPAPPPLAASAWRFRLRLRPPPAAQARSLARVPSSGAAAPQAQLEPRDGDRANHRSAGCPGIRFLGGASNPHSAT